MNSLKMFIVLSHWENVCQMNFEIFFSYPSQNDKDQQNNDEQILLVVLGTGSAT